MKLTKNSTPIYVSYDKLEVKCIHRVFWLCKKLAVQYEIFHSYYLMHSKTTNFQAQSVNK